MKHYTLIGLNGIGIYTNYETLKKSRTFVKCSTIRSFDSYDEAYNWIMAYADFPMVCEIPDRFPLNYTVYFKNMK